VLSIYASANIVNGAERSRCDEFRFQNKLCRCFRLLIATVFVVHRGREVESRGSRLEIPSHMLDSKNPHGSVSQLSSKQCLWLDSNSKTHYTWRIVKTIGPCGPDSFSESSRPSSSSSTMSMISSSSSPIMEISRSSISLLIFQKAVGPAGPCRSKSLRGF